ncbi:hypothetical protein [Flavobacterium sp. ASV13]|uniref:hypothetical protein n=1 Tax=Flavobacterium sp. ASV13 TaxID=1506583 RepID=UPI00054DF4B0|nr:hypothetical protein [Flavobacterium sp. ASV13]
MALKSDNPTNAKINQNFIIRVLENPKEKSVKNTKLTSANKLSNYLKDEELKIKLFKKILFGEADKYVFNIRNRLRIEIQSK